MKNTGKSSEALFEQLLRKRWGKRVHIERLADSAEVHGRTKGRGWNRAQPSDFFVTENGQTYYAEVKSTQAKTSFSPSQVEKKQKATATMTVAAGGEYFFFIHRIKTGEWFKVPAKVFIENEWSALKWTDAEPYKWELSND